MFLRPQPMSYIAVGFKDGKPSDSTDDVIITVNGMPAEKYRNAVIYCPDLIKGYFLEIDKRFVNDTKKNPSHHHIKEIQCLSSLTYGNDIACGGNPSGENGPCLWTSVVYGPNITCQYVHVYKYATSQESNKNCALKCLVSILSSKRIYNAVFIKAKAQKEATHKKELAIPAKLLPTIPGIPVELRQNFNGLDYKIVISRIGIEK